MANRVLIRADASLAIGTGHVWRCLTLAHLLAQRGDEVHFLCRETPGHMMEQIRNQGFACHGLPGSDDFLAHPIDAWPQKDVAEDIDLSAKLAGQLRPDWIILDHYALSARWEQAVTGPRARCLVIDDLYSRAHVADLLLNQNLGATDARYHGQIGANCQTLLGPGYALLRPEFTALRDETLTRRAQTPPARPRLLLSMGGVDLPNATGWILEQLAAMGGMQDWPMDIVLGPTCPHKGTISTLARSFTRAKVHIGTTQMARLMAMADISIGAAGSTSWERCCLGLPTILAVMAENQRPAAQSLADTGAAIAIDFGNNAGLAAALTQISDPLIRQALTRVSARLCDGRGADRVAQAMQSAPTP